MRLLHVIVSAVILTHSAGWCGEITQYDLKDYYPTSLLVGKRITYDRTSTAGPGTAVQTVTGPFDYNGKAIYQFQQQIGSNTEKSFVAWSPSFLQEYRVVNSEGTRIDYTDPREMLPRVIQTSYRNEMLGVSSGTLTETGTGITHTIEGSTYITFHNLDYYMLGDARYNMLTMTVTTNIVMDGAIVFDVSQTFGVGKNIGIVVTSSTTTPGPFHDVRMLKSVPSVTVQGNVSYNGQPLAGVEMKGLKQLGPQIGSVKTNQQGRYVGRVLFGQYVEIQPTLSPYDFQPRYGRFNAINGNKWVNFSAIMD